MDITTDCWSPGHLKWIFTLGVPMLIFYVVGCPLLAFLILYKNRNRLDKPEVLKYIILLYQGLKHDRYYWELINTGRKCLLLSLHVFIPDDLKIMKALFGVLTLFVISLIQARLKPFKISIITSLEHREMVASLLTLYGGLIFAQKDKELSALSVTFFVIIMLANIRFLILWVFCVTTVYKTKRQAEILGQWIKRAFCLKVNEEDEDYLCYKSKLTTTNPSKDKSKESKFTTYKDKQDDIHTTKRILKRTLESKHTQIVQEYFHDQLDETFSSMRTPKKLLNQNNEEGTTRTKRKIKMSKPTLFKRRKVKKRNKPSKPLTKGDDSMDTGQGDQKIVEFFGQPFNQSDLNSKMGGKDENTRIKSPKSNKSKNKNKEESKSNKINIFYLDGNKNLKGTFLTSPAVLPNLFPIDMGVELPVIKTTNLAEHHIDLSSKEDLDEEAHDIVFDQITKIKRKK